MDVIDKPRNAVGETVSFKGRRWRVAQGPKDVADKLAISGINPVAARILASRNVTVDSLDDFVNPELRKLMPDPYFLLDMEKAVVRSVTAIENKERIGIWSDYDADGATSATIFGEFLEMLGHHDYVLRIPDRIKEGYGPNTPGLLDMKANQGCNFVCILDAGIVAFEPLEAAKAAGMDIVVLDHHMAEPELPVGVAIVNPNRRDQPKGLGHLCAAGVTFMFAVAVVRELYKKGWFEKTGRAKPALMELLPIVALGTVCDVMPLTGLNRAFVYQGLKRAQARKNYGLLELARVSGVEDDKEITEKHFGWQIGPRINAGGRIGDPLAASHLLLEKDPKMAAQRAQELDHLNVVRKDIEKGMTAAAIEQLSDRVPGVTRTLALAVVDGHEGVVGISAGRLRETYDAPAIVLTEDHEGNVKGSARSVPGFDIGHGIIEARKKGLIIKGGGHGAAGGLTLRKDQLPGFIEFMNKEIEKTEYFETGVVSDADIALRVNELSVQAIEAFDVLRPFGQGNPEPRVIIKGALFSELKVMKEVHYKLILEGGGASFEAILWNAAGTPLGDKILDARGAMVDVLGNPGINEFRGRKSVQMMLEDIRFAE